MMTESHSNDPYAILGVSKTASDEEIKSSYRKLAKRYHPDLNPSDKEAEQRFQSISTAYAILSDPEKRTAFDKGEIDMEGHPLHTQSSRYRHTAYGPQGTRYYQNKTGRFGEEDIQEMFGSFFKGGMGGTSAGFKQQSTDAYYSTEVDFMTAALGGKHEVTMPDGKVLNITIPAGIKDGQRLRLLGQGSKGSMNTPRGDAYVAIHIKPHDFFTRKDQNIYLEVPVDFHEIILEHRIKVPTIHGPIELALPKNAKTGTLLRLQGKGIKGGDQYVRVKVTIPDDIDTPLTDAIKTWAENHTTSPRQHMEAIT